MAFNSSLSGMKAANADLNVTSHNIANVGTTGFKESRAEFAEVFSTTGYGLLRNGIGAEAREHRQHDGAHFGHRQHGRCGVRQVGQVHAHRVARPNAQLV